MEEKIWNCIVKRLNGTETPESKAVLDVWLAENEANRKKYMEAKSIWELSTTIDQEEPALSFRLFSAQLEPKIELIPKKPKLFWKYGIAATITAVLLISGWYHVNYNGAKDQINWIVKRAEAGQVIKVSLPDRSTVWLNSDSEISFASEFNEQPSRLVKLSGEAYFEVKHNQKHPFVVKSNHLTTTVYGTSFSVSAYRNELRSSVAVNSGKVGVAATDKRHLSSSIMLLPNDQLIFNSKSKRFSKSNIAKGDVNAWTKRELVFEQTPLQEVVNTLSRTYKVTINTSQITGANCRLTARFKNQPLPIILKVLKLSLHIQSTQVKQTIYLKGGNCM